MAPPPVDHRDLVYREVDGDPLLARVYTPGDGPVVGRPAVVEVHGGAWRYFDRTLDVWLNQALAATGLVVIAIDIRQAPDHRWPTAAQDVVAGVRWVREHADELGVAADGIGLLGCSSGGHLALVGGLLPTDVDLGSVDRAEVAYVAAFWPIAQPDERYRYVLDRLRDHPEPVTDPVFEPVRLRRAHDRFFSGEAAMAEASIVRMLSEGAFRRLPPIWVNHAELDENVTAAMTDRLIAAYEAAGGQAALDRSDGVGHGFIQAGGPAAEAALGRLRAFIGRHVRASGPDTDVR